MTRHDGRHCPLRNNDQCTLQHIIFVRLSGPTGYRADNYYRFLDHVKLELEADLLPVHSIPSASQDLDETPDVRAESEGGDYDVSSDGGDDLTVSPMVDMTSQGLRL